MNKNSFCYLPFSHVLLKTTGTIGVCCHYKPQPEDVTFNINTNGIDSWWNSEQQQKLRNQLLAGEKPAGCNYCYQMEEQGFESLRVRTLEEFKLYRPDIASPDIISVEADIENVCNLKCMMCNEYSSSELLKENKALKISNYNQKDYVWSDDSYNSLVNLIETKKLKLLSLRAGEPLFNKKVKKLLLELPASALEKTLLHITSNMTIWDDEWANIFSKFKFVRVLASVDGTEKTYEYIRFPGSWETTSKNILEVKKLKNVNIVLRCTVQNLNIVYLDEFINWANTNNLYIGSGVYGILLDPEFFSYLNLSPSLNKLAIRRLSKINNPPEMVDVLINNLKNGTFDESKWNEFVAHVKMKDEFRQINIKNYLPDFQIY